MASHAAALVGQPDRSEAWSGERGQREDSFHRAASHLRFNGVLLAIYGLVKLASYIHTLVDPQQVTLADALAGPMSEQPWNYLNRSLQEGARDTAFQNSGIKIDFGSKSILGFFFF